MIWYHEILEGVKLAALGSVRLLGIYNPPEEQITKPAIQIIIEITYRIDRDHTITHELFSDTPKGLVHEEPTADEICMKYRHKINKLRTKVLSTSYDVAGNPVDEDLL